MAARREIAMARRARRVMVAAVEAPFGEMEVSRGVYG